MKKLNFTLVILILSGVILSGFTFEKSENYKLSFTANSPLDLSGLLKKSEVKKDESNPESSDWYTEALSNIQKAEYNVSFSEDLNAFQSPNRANNMRFVYNKNGFTAMLRNNKVAMFDESDKTIEEKNKKYNYLDEWKVNFKIENVSKELNSNTENHYTDFDGNEFNTSNNQISIENENLRIQYLNDEKGMRQDFIVKNKPEGDGQLRLNINADTELKMITGADALMFKDDKGDLKLKYAALKVWDANGKELRAYFEEKLQISNDKLQIENQEKQSACGGPNQKNHKSQIQNSNFQIVVNDDEAVYPITIDPLSSVANWTAEINQASANFGWSVATAGDVNGDGYSDVIVGAPNYDNGQTDEGGVFVYYGSITGLSLSPSWTKEINQASANFGWSVATAGDVNGDGNSDVIIGAPNYDSVQSNEGRAYIYLGSLSGLQSGYIWKFEVDQVDAKFGYSVACAGDIDNDGYSDVIIGSPFYDNGQTDEGRVYSFNGSSTGLNLVTADWTYESNQTSAQLGFSVATAGDVNGDGASDVIIGANLYDNGATINAGRVYVFNSFHGALPSTPNTTKNGSRTDENFGWSVSTAGDVNGDGYSDIIIGSPFYYGGQTDEGKCFVYPGSSSGIAATAIWSAESDHTGGQFGISVSTAGDMNGDGYADIIAGGNYLDNGQTDEGRALVYLGYSGGIRTNSEVIYESNQASSQFGYSVATAGDINGDGFSDVICGAYNFDNPNTNEGAAFVYLGSAAGMSASSNWSAEGNQAYAYFGNSVCTAGDVNGDGYSDVIIGAHLFDNGQSEEGAAFVFHGSASGLSPFSNWSAEGNQANIYFGYSVSTAGDVNGDGYSDVIIGAFGYGNGQNSEGAAFVYHGSASGLSITSNWSAEGNQVEADFGISVSTAGDVNGDGFSDVIVGASYFDNGQSNEGAAFVYHGSASGLSLTSNWSAEGNQVEALLGNSVSTAGDVNGDGYSDVIIGAYYYDNGQTNEGAAFVSHGSASGLSLYPNWIGEKNQAYAGFGYSVSSAGDVNGDGYSDVIVGAYTFDNGQTDEGAAFVYHGSSAGISITSNWTAEGNQAYANFGYSVSSAGDVNGDGYSDVIVGAPSIDNGISEQGAAYVYQGSATVLSLTSNWNASGNQAYANFGRSVSTAGDVNGDGYSDVIAGANAFDNGQTDEGAAFVYYGGNDAGGLQATVRQYKFGTSTVVSSGSNTGDAGKVRLQHFAKSPFGRSNGRVVYEIKENGIPFSGSIISNSTSYDSTPPSYTNLGLTGTNISQDMTGFNSSKLYKWRARTQYKMTSSPFQKFSPWRYYTNYVPNPSAGFRPKSNLLYLNLTMFIEGFYNAGTDAMVGDTVKVFLRNSSSPYSIVDSSKSFVSSAGLGIYTFSNAVNGTNYYIHMKHRNSIETWSKTVQQFTSSALAYNFTTANTQAYGNNMIQIDASPVKFGIYSGDVNQDGTIDLADGSLIDNDAFNFVSGYVSTDVNGDGIVDLADAVFTDNNGFNFVGKITP
ncbi:MAG: FG-GAP repeat protein [Bacteroidetes bacterium]|nr:FG-GAP repeat protein [Bacteroidota bacterium]